MCRSPGLPRLSCAEGKSTCPGTTDFRVDVIKEEKGRPIVSAFEPGKNSVDSRQKERRDMTVVRGAGGEKCLVARRAVQSRCKRRQLKGMTKYEHVSNAGSS